MSINDHNNINIDSHLITQTLLGHKSSYNALVKKHQHAVRKFIATRCRYSSDVDDIAQECFIMAYQKLVELEKNQHFRAWLCGIALNLVRNHHRKFNPTANNNEDELSQLISDQLETQITQSAEDISLAALNGCIDTLNEPSKQLIDLHYKQALPVKMLAEKLKLKHSTLTMRLHRIRDILRQCISDKLARDNL